MKSTAPLKIEIYTDIICPWCLVGEARLDNVLARHSSMIDADIEHHPMLLMPDCPPGGVKALDLLRSRYGDFDPASFWARPEAEARDAGVDLDLSKQAMIYPTAAAHSLIRHARSRGTQHALASALIRAYFLDALDISDPDVLSDIAAQHGFEREEARPIASSPQELAATYEASQISIARGVRSVPTFVVNGRAIQPRDERELENALMDLAGIAGING